MAVIEGGSGFGGSARSLLRIAEVLRREYPELIHPVFFFLTPSATALFKQAGYETIYFTTRFRRFFECRVLLKQHRIQLLHCNNEPYSHLFHILAARSLGIPVTVHIRGNRTITGREERLMRMMMKGFAVSEGSRINALTASGIPADRILTVGDGIDLSACTPGSEVRTAMRHALSLREEELAILIPSTLQPGKGQEIALAAAAHLRGRFPLRWFFAGEEHYQFHGYQAHLAARIQALHLTECCHLLGHREDIPQLLAAADLMLMPSTLKEGMPCVIMEAMAAGRPVIASRIGGIPEAVTSLSGGLFTPGEADDLVQVISGVLEGSRPLSEYGRESRRIAEEHFDIRPTAALLAREWRALVPGDNLGAPVSGGKT